MSVISLKYIVFLVHHSLSADFLKMKSQNTLSTKSVRVYYYLKI